MYFDPTSTVPAVETREEQIAQVQKLLETGNIGFAKELMERYNLEEEFAQPKKGWLK